MFHNHNFGDDNSVKPTTEDTADADTADVEETETADK